MVRDGRSILTVKRKEAEAVESEPQRLYAEAAMADIRSHRRFFDWSSLQPYTAAGLAKARDYYHSLSQEKKLERVRKRREREINDHGGVDGYRQFVTAKRNQWKSRNPERHREIAAKYMKDRKNSDPGFRVQCNLRNRLKDLIVTCRKGGSWQISSLIGCSTAQLAKHLESKFKRGMTWANYGTHWHVDHVLPCASFNQQDPRQRAQCWHWTNLEPLEAKKNLEKSDTITHPQMQLLLCATH
jgi:hypothetical protein